jgi:hypothetical protein
MDVASTTPTPERSRRKRLPGPVRGGKPVPPELCRQVQRKFNFTESYAAWLDEKAELLDVDRQIVVDLALRVLAGLMRWDSPPPFDPRLMPRGPFLPGMEGVPEVTADGPPSA